MPTNGGARPRAGRPKKDGSPPKSRQVAGSSAAPAPPPDPPPRVSSIQDRETWLETELAELDASIPMVESLHGWTASVNLRRQRSEHHLELSQMRLARELEDAASPEALERTLIETLRQLSPDLRARIMRAAETDRQPPKPGKAKTL